MSFQEESSGLSHTSLFGRSITPSGSFLNRRSIWNSSKTSLSSQHTHEDCHHARLGEYAADLWKQNAMTDVLITVQNKEFKAHKAVLACYSPYFKEVLLKPGANIVHSLDIPCVDPKAFEILLEYMYTGEMNVTCQDLAEVYRASRRLGMKDALNKCREMLTVSSQSIENTIYLYVTAKKLDLLDPSMRAFHLMLSHFETLAGTKEFLDLEIDQIIDLYCADTIAARSEMNLYLAALNWINYKFLEREPHVDRILGCVRFPLMNLNEILLCHHPPLLPGIVLYPKVKEALYNATCYVAAKHMGQEVLFKELSCEPRTYLLEEQPPILWDYESLYNPDLYPEYRDSKAATKIQASFRGYITRKRVEKNYREKSLAAVIIQSAFRSYRARKKLRSRKGMRQAQLTGSYPHEQYREWDACDFEEYDSETKRDSFDSSEAGATSSNGNPVIRTESKTSNFSNLSINCLKNVIYAVGGFDTGGDYTKTNTVFCYSPIANAWKDIGLLPEPRYDVRIALHEGILYCIGGCHPKQMSSAKMVPNRGCFKFCLEEQKWIKMAPLKSCRMFHGVAVLNDAIYAIGGKDEKSRILSSVERYDPSSDNWSESAPMGTPRMGMGVTTYDDQIWVAGGLTGLDNRLVLIDIVECFDAKTRRWIRRVKLPHPVAFLALVECRGKLYSIGGAFQDSSDKQELLSVNEVFVYDQKNDYWRMAVGLPNPWHSVVASSLGDDIYILGGHSAQNFAWLQVVFYYNSVLRRWRNCCHLPPSAAGRVIAAVGSTTDE